MRWGVRPPLKDLWTNKAFSFDESFNIFALLGVSSLAPIILIRFVGRTEELLPEMTTPYPAIVFKTLLYIAGLVAAILLVLAVSWVVSKVAAPEEGFKGAIHYANVYAPALVPIPLMKLIADIIDHILRNGSSAIIVAYNFVVDFPRGSPDAPGTLPVESPLALNDPVLIFAIQATIMLIGFFASAFVLNKLAVNWEPQRKFSSALEARYATTMMLMFSLALTLFNTWALSGPATA
jgi:hypothetical protein